MIFRCFVQSIKDSMYKLNVNPLKVHAKILSPGYDKLIPEDLLDKIKDNEYVEKIVPCKFYTTNYMLTGNMTSTYIYALRNEDMDYVIEKHTVSIEEGRLPEAGKAELALDYRIAKNKRVAVGDKIGSKVDKSDWLDGEYTIVGILRSDDYISIRPCSITDTTINEEQERYIYISKRLIVSKGK